ncbi:MAG TPA: class I SAM-dependent methyltransferase [Candidatus Saccharimonadales bacterium]|nr:class I SAM-dependent methyltransferase [Candidatus Saccharimonadales bacterium]
MNSTFEQNRRAWDERARRGEYHTEAATRKELADPLAALDECGWLGPSVRGQRVLCLAAGGGKHSVLFALAGATVTVVDLSPAMLEQDRRMAVELNVSVRIVETTMTDLSMLADASFELVIQPVSTCYVQDVGVVYREVARVLASGGLYISQHKQPASLQAEVQVRGAGYLLTEPYYRSGALPTILPGCLHREAGTIEFLHRWTELLGGMCRAGFVIEDLVEPRHGRMDAEPGSFPHRSSFLPPFVTVKARRNGAGPTAHLEAAGAESIASATPRIWVPER